MNVFMMMNVCMITDDDAFNLSFTIKFTVDMD